jgi:hypothetical protein
MHPYVPFAALPVAVIAAVLFAPDGSATHPSRYQVPKVVDVKDPSAPKQVRTQPAGTPEIRVQAFLPHQPPVPPAPEPTLVLHSVLTGKGVRLATINGEVVKEGDRLQGYLVRRIAADGVELAKGETTRRLPMRPLHELPAPVEPEPVQDKATIARRADADLTEDFWKIFDSLKP